jgi:hypothetical protein
MRLTSCRRLKLPILFSLLVGFTCLFTISPYGLLSLNMDAADDLFAGINT